MAAHQCIPDTAPASTHAETTVFHHESAHACRNTKKTASATLLATTAMKAAPTT